MPLHDAPRTDTAARPTIDWRGWIALAWAVVFGLLYAKSMIEQKAPGALAAARKAVGMTVGR